MGKLTNFASVLLLIAAGSTVGANAVKAADELAPEKLHVEKIPAGPRDHWIWVGDVNPMSNVDTRAMLYDADKGKMLGMLSTGYWGSVILLPKSTGDVVSLETYFEHGTRGKRHDYVVVYDPQTLKPLHEIEIPPRRMTALIQSRMGGLTDDDHFVAVTNFTPAQTISIVDLQTNKFVEEVNMAGCGQIYPAGPRRLLTLCGDATLRSLMLDDTGHVIDQVDGKPFFDPFGDPVIIHAVRAGDDWLFASFAGYIYQIDASKPETSLREKWSLLSDSERKAGWRTAGYQSLAVQKSQNRLYALMRKGPEDTYEQPGDEIWVYDIASHERVEKITLENTTLAIEVSQDAKPIVYAASLKTVVPYWTLAVMSIIGIHFEELDIVKPALDVYDAASGEHLRTVDHVAQFATSLQQP
ncbi:MAG: amine dehydrogenase large subunit [Parvibaculum sp.]